MAKITPFTALLLLLCFSCFLSHGLGLSHGLKSTLDSESSDSAVDAGENFNLEAAGKGEDWFHWGFPHLFPHPWPFVHPPMPAGGFKWPHWPFVHPPMPADGFKWPPKQWPHWPFVHPPMPAGGFKWPPKQWPHWPFVHPPMPAGGFKWPPKQWPHWPFVHPPMPAGGKWPPHWPFVHPPFPCPWWPHHGSESGGIGAKRIDAAAAPPPAA